MENDDKQAVRCPKCGKENPPNGTFCIYCGGPMVGLSSEGQDIGPHGQDPPLEEDLREVRQVLSRLADRVAVLEQRQAGPNPRVSGEVAATTPSSGPLPDSHRLEAGIRPAGGIAPPSRPPQPIVPAASEEVPSDLGPSIDWERVLGLNWLAIVGSVALVIGMGFFLRLAIENQWIGETGQIILGMAVGLTLLGVGEYTQRRYVIWAQAVTGGGIAILYLSIYAAFGFYNLIDPLVGFLFLALVVVLSGLLALRYESLVIALVGIFGAFLTPVLMGQVLGPEQRLLLLLYILLVDVGILGVSTFRNWRWLTLVGVVASYTLFAAWLDQIPAREVLVAQMGLTGIFLIFVGATTLFHVLWRRVPEPADMALMAINAAAYYGLTFGLLWPQYEVWFGPITLTLSLFYGLVGYVAIRRSGAPPEVALYTLTTALVFLTIAVPLQLSDSWITIAWAAEGAVLVWVGFVLRSWRIRAFGLGVLAIAALRLLVFETPIRLVDFQPFLNDRFPTFVVAIAAFYVGAYLYWRERDHLEGWERNVLLVMAGAANLFTLWILSAEAIAYFDSRELAVRSSGFQAMQDAENGKFLSLTALWAVYAFGLLAIALRTRFYLLRWAGLALLSVAALKLLLVDTFIVDLNPRTFTLILNFHFLNFLIVLAVVLFAAYLYWRQKEEILDGREVERYVFLALVVAANIVAFWVLSAEAFRFYDGMSVRVNTDFTNAKQLTLTILWALYAIGILGVGIVRQSSTIRLAGIAVLGVAVLKLFLFDVFLLERGYRAAAFLALGFLLLVAGLAYQRYSQAVRGFLVGKSA